MERRKRGGLSATRHLFRGAPYHLSVLIAQLQSCLTRISPSPCLRSGKTSAIGAYKCDLTRARRRSLKIVDAPRKALMKLLWRPDLERACVVSVAMIKQPRSVWVDARSSDDDRADIGQAGNAKFRRPLPRIRRAVPDSRAEDWAKDVMPLDRCSAESAKWLRSYLSPVIGFEYRSKRPGPPAVPNHPKAQGSPAREGESLNSMWEAVAAPFWLDACAGSSHDRCSSPH